MTDQVDPNRCPAERIPNPGPYEGTDQCVYDQGHPEPHRDYRSNTWSTGVPTDRAAEAAALARLELVRDTVNRADAARLDRRQTRSVIRAALDPNVTDPWAATGFERPTLPGCGCGAQCETFNGIRCELPDGHAGLHGADRYVWGTR
jgi:hypothetical protein